MVMVKLSVAAIMVLLWLINVCIDGFILGTAFWMLFAGAGYLIGRYFPLWPR